MANSIGLWMTIELYVWRFLASIASLCDRRLFRAHAPRAHNFTLSIPVTGPPGSITIYVWTPPNYVRPSPSSATSSSAQRHPLLVNFHGGGYTMGNAIDDTRWCAQAADGTGSVVVSVEYRLAPKNPFPDGIRDCAAAIQYLWANADALGVDPQRTMLSGFSAGGNFCFTVPIYLCQQGQHQGLSGPVEGRFAEGRLVGVVPFYPALDYTRPRQEKLAGKPRATGVPKRLFPIFNRSYLTPELRTDSAHSLLSPGRAADEVLRNAMPRRIALFPCELDILLEEAEAARQRLKELGKVVGGRVIPEAIHGWDKRPRKEGPEEKTVRAYHDAIKEMREMIEDP